MISIAWALLALGLILMGVSMPHLGMNPVGSATILGIGFGINIRNVAVLYKK